VVERGNCEGFVAEPLAEGFLRHLEGDDPVQLSRAL
jgi:hypothetical protein